MLINNPGGARDFPATAHTDEPPPYRTDEVFANLEGRTETSGGVDMDSEGGNTNRGRERESEREGEGEGEGEGGSRHSSPPDYDIGASKITANPSLSDLDQNTNIEQTNNIKPAALHTILDASVGPDDDASFASKSVTKSVYSMDQDANSIDQDEASAAVLDQDNRSVESDDVSYDHD